MPTIPLSPPHSHTLTLYLRTISCFAGALLGPAFSAPGTDAETHRHAGWLEDWPITAVKGWDGHKEIEIVRAPEAPGAQRPRGTDSQSDNTHTPKAQFERLTVLIRQQAARILMDIRPDLVGLIDRAPLQENGQGLLKLVHADPSRPPLIRMEWTVDQGRPRPTYLQIHAKETGSEPPPDLRRRWQSYGKKSLAKVFGNEPQGKLTIQPFSNGFYFSWVPFWEGLAMPRAFGTRFGAFKHQDHWVLAWTARSSPQLLLSATRSLDRYPFRPR